MFHIASTESTIKSMTTEHEELLKNREEDFMYATAPERREVHQYEEKCADLQRILMSSDVVEREQKVLQARLAALRVDDEKEEVANAREMDGLKRNLFNVRNDLENVFRTTLHDLNMSYQEQAFDAMVEEAIVARGELPTLRTDLRVKTRNVNRVMAEHCRSFQGAGCAKVERDLADTFVKLQAKRGEKLRQSVRSQKEVIVKEQEEMKDLGNRLEEFQAEAGELTKAAAELRQARAESARTHEEYLHARRWAHTLAKKGPKALKAELKRRRLAALTAATVASFKASRREDSGFSCSPDEGDGGGADSASLGSSLPDSPDDAAAVSCDASSAGGSSSDGRGEESEVCSRNGDARLTDADAGTNRGVSNEDDDEHRAVATTAATAAGDFYRPTAILDGGAVATAPPSAERRDTLTLVSGMEIGGLGVDADAAATGFSKLFKTTKPENNATGVIGDVPRIDRRLAAASERIWRASLSGNHDINNSYHEHGRRNGGGRAEAKDASKAGVVPGGVRDEVPSTDGMGSLQAEGHWQRQAPPRLPSGSTPPATSYRPRCSRACSSPITRMASAGRRG
ncbi:conserved unknown protein [Ectocarpus siliculosus]|uniref:Uncharacterized protein n=1 Tax=Ectocarpus siliculosus TaxID=2880 RepID=D7FHP8_ECTSI|nr:conserved unknown protein [Ectocarpus siliculosus]|eukprot:CBJ28603.1 conserved unknown protein [Ectocarpus siliculosus]